MTKFYFLLFLTFFSSHFSFAALWEVENEWSIEWEKRYGAWIKEKVTLNFFSDIPLRTDCADVAYALRTIFSRVHKLPVLFHLKGSKTFTHNTSHSSWRKLPRSTDWRKDQYFLAALNYLLDETYTHTLYKDAYPVTVSRDSFFPGIFYLMLSGDSGHTYIVSEVNTEAGSIEVPLKVVYSTVPRQIRTLIKVGFWESRLPELKKSGFLRFRWPIKHVDGSYFLANAQDMPDYSLEQYEQTFLGDRETFAYAVLEKLNPNFNLENRLNDGIESAMEQIIFRQKIVDEGYMVCSVKPCPKESSNYDNYSTFSRDERLDELLSHITRFVYEMQFIDPKLTRLWEEAKTKKIIQLNNGQELTLGEIVYIFRIKSYNSDPNERPEIRWGL